MRISFSVIANSRMATSLQARISSFLWYFSMIFCKVRIKVDYFFSSSNKFKILSKNQLPKQVENICMCHPLGYLCLPLNIQRACRNKLFHIYIFTFLCVKICNADRKNSQVKIKRLGFFFTLLTFISRKLIKMKICNSCRK